jgi:2-iminobutanoate/2-iminopropanoate deaminase
MKTKLNSPTFAERMGAYSHGYAVEMPGGGTIIYTTGQIALDSDGKAVSVGDPAGQARYVFESLAKILGSAGASLDDVVKVNIYVTNMDDFKAISGVRNEFLAKSEPVSTLVQVQQLVNSDCVIEIEAVAVVY